MINLFLILVKLKFAKRGFKNKTEMRRVWSLEFYYFENISNNKLFWNDFFNIDNIGIQKSMFARKPNYI